ncbi:MAG: PQQ-dependent sugar dehydrogenase [Saprospiraceae bacterium]|nr:PQQ-dependent sugar dehydrogenase [Saprospiraceae bacterium]
MNLLNIALITILCVGLSNSSTSQSIELKLMASGFKKPVDIASTGVEGDVRLFVVEKDGIIKILGQDGTTLSIPFLDIDSKVNSQANERGLLGLCFHPEYETNGFFYVNYTNNNGNTTISRFKRNEANPNLADNTSEKIILLVNQPFNNHNAGDLNFGADGYLYVGMGDGGSGGDPGNRSQNPKEMLGKMLRIDINTENEKYLIPADNPYKNNTDTLPEIWAMGLRNPWRFSFDKVKNEMWIADVGQDKFEEINVASATKSGLNYGWRCYEGFERFNSTGCKEQQFYYPPVYSYENKFDIGCSVTGGYVYRGTKNTSLAGKYIYTDFCTGILWALYKDQSGSWINEVLLDADNMDYATFGEDNTNELYLAGLATGNIYQLSEKTSSIHQDGLKSSPFSIVSNPVSDLITIKMHEINKSSTRWYICNSTGIVVKSWFSKTNDSEFSIETNELPTGEYMIYNETNIGYSKKFIKI